MPLALFTGNAVCAVSKTGAVRLPSFIRAVIDGRAAGSMMVGLHEFDPCLVVRDLPEIFRVHHERLLLSDDARHSGRASARETFGLLEDAAYEANGAIKVSSAMRRRVSIGTLALVIGVGAGFELWGTERALASPDTLLRDLITLRLDTAL